MVVLLATLFDLVDRLGVCPCPKKKLEAGRVAISGGQKRQSVSFLRRGTEEATRSD